MTNLRRAEPILFRQLRVLERIYYITIKFI